MSILYVKYTKHTDMEATVKKNEISITNGQSKPTEVFSVVSVYHWSKPESTKNSRWSSENHLGNLGIHGEDTAAKIKLVVPSQPLMSQNLVELYKKQMDGLNKSSMQVWFCIKCTKYNMQTQL